MERNGTTLPFWVWEGVVMMYLDVVFMYLFCHVVQEIGQIEAVVITASR
jgi:hypothetical protein